MRAFVTGATGVVGGSLVRHLVERGDAVTAFGRRPVPVPGAVVTTGSLLSHRQLADAMAGHDVVYHVAGVNRLCPSDVAEMYEVNVDGARTVARAAASAGVARLVHTSSVAAADTHPPSHYARSKRFGEQAVLAESGMDVVVVRPASVQGPGRATGSAKVILDIITGRLRYAIDTTVSIVDIDDCAAAHRAAALHGLGGRTYTVAGFTLSIRQALDMVAGMLNRDLDVRYVPIQALAVAAPVLGLPRLWGREPLVCPEMVKTLRADHVHDGALAGIELGFDYRSAEETIGRLLDWFTRTGAIG